jgi:hypothetical protein
MLRRVKRLRAGRRLTVEALESRHLLAPMDPAQMDQVIVEMINRARANPTAEATRLGIGLNDGLATATNPTPISTDPKPPLAINDLLYAAAFGHSTDMVERNYFNHISPEGNDPGDRLADVNYPFTTWGENIAYTYDLQQFHDLLFKSPGHRRNILRESFREIGVGLVLDSGRYTGTELFASRGGNAFLTGVVFSDRVMQDQFLSLGESLGGVTVTAERPGAPILSTITGPGGGYSLQAAPGTYKVRAIGPGLPYPIEFTNVVVGSTNVKVDFIVPDVQIDPDARESNDVPAQASVLTGPNIDLTGLTIHSRDDLDYFRWVPSAVGNATVTLELEQDLGDLDLVILDDQGTILGDSRTQTSRETVTLAVTPDRPLTILVFGYEQALHGNYRLLINGPLPGPPPIARPDRVFADLATPVSIAILANDEAPQSRLRADRVAITQAPLVGEAVWDAAQQQLVYTPPAGFRGLVEFQYHVENEQGTQSNTTTVRVTVVNRDSVPWQNPREPFDVNGDGSITSMDALQLINSLNTRSARLLLLPRLNDEFPSPYLDVDGDDHLTPLDVLYIVNSLNAGGTTGQRFLAPSHPRLATLQATNDTGAALRGVVTRSLVTLEPGRFQPLAHQLWVANPVTGERVAAQAQVLTLHDDGSAAQVEVIFPVTMADGERQTLALQRRGGAPVTRSMPLPTGLNLAPNSDLLVARLHDSAGNLYQANLLANALGKQIGQVDNRWVEVHEFVAPLNPASPEASSHPQLWRLRTFITIRRDEPAVGLRVQIESNPDAISGGDAPGSNDPIADLFFSKLQVGVKQMTLAWVKQPDVTPQPTTQDASRTWTDAIPAGLEPYRANDFLSTALQFELAPLQPPTAGARATEYALNPPPFLVVPNP